MNEFFNKMKEILGDRFYEYKALLNEKPYRALRVNTLKISTKNLKQLMPDILRDKTPFCDEGYYIDSSIEHIGNHPLHHAGAFYVQEPSAMSAVEALDIKKGDKVLDLCAAPGSKSTQIAAKLDSTGLLWANEYISSRANILLSNIERMGIKNAVVSNMDTKPLCEKLGGFFDKILVDAPCSGEGMFRKDRNAINEWNENAPFICAKRQREILENAKAALKPGGILVYSTCTFSKEENEGVIESFLADNPQFELIDTGFDFGTNTLKFAKRIYPFDKGEGHFVAKLKRREDNFSSTGYIKPYLIPQMSNNTKEFIKDFISNNFKNINCNNMIEQNSRIYILPENSLLPDFSKLKILRAGVKFGEIKKGRIEPCHHFATSMKTNNFLRAVDLRLDDQELMRFLRGEEIECDKILKGYTVVSVEGLTLSLAKASNGKLKNKYPKGLRNF